MKSWYGPAPADHCLQMLRQHSLKCRSTICDVREQSVDTPSSSRAVVPGIRSFEASIWKWYPHVPVKHCGLSVRTYISFLQFGYSPLLPYHVSAKPAVDIGICSHSVGYISTSLLCAGAQNVLALL
jgi:hypothetical protein